MLRGNLKFGVMLLNSTEDANALLPLIKHLSSLNYDGIWLDSEGSKHQKIVTSALSVLKKMELGIEVPSEVTTQKNDLETFLHRIEDPRQKFRIDVRFSKNNDPLLLDSIHRHNLTIESQVSPHAAAIAGTHGLPLTSANATTPGGLNALAVNWEIYQRKAKLACLEANRNCWSLIAPMHISTTTKQAFKDVQFGIEKWIKNYETMHQVKIVPANCDSPARALVDSGFAVIGTARDATAQIKRLQDASGGFGQLLQLHHCWVQPQDFFSHYKIFAHKVMPKFR